LKYQELKLIYEGLSQDIQDSTFEDILLACNEIDMHFIKKVIQNAENAIRSNNHEIARAKYTTMEEAFNRLSPKLQEQILPEITRIHSMLS